jgi:hypothetical protein
VEFGWKTQSVEWELPATVKRIYYYIGSGYTGDPWTGTQLISTLTLDLLQTSRNTIVPESLQFTLGGGTFEDRPGANLVLNGSTPAGAIDLTSGIATLTDWPDGGANTLTVTSLLTKFGQWSARTAVIRTAASPLKPEALGLYAETIANGAAVTASGDADGVLVGTGITGTVNYEMGTAQITFTAPVDPTTIRYNAVAYAYLPLDATILGIDAVRLPSDGRVPIFHPGDVVMVMHPDTTTGTPAQVGGTGPYLLSCGRTRLAWVRVTDANGATIYDGYSLDRATGVLSWDSLAGLATPLTVQHTVGDLRLITDAQIDGTLTLARPLSHDFPADESLVGSCLLHGDRRARVSALWFQSSWNGTWLDYAVGSAPIWALDVIAHPFVVTNEGAITERWVLRWLNTSTVQIIGETRGVIYEGAFTGDLAPINPFTREPDGSGGVPYFTIPLASQSGGQSAGNAARFNTVGALVPLWIARSIGQSDEPLDDGADGCEVYALGNIDRP